MTLTNTLNYSNNVSYLSFGQRIQLPVESVKAYYHEIDTLDFEKVLKRFSPDAIYQREGWPDLKGFDSISDFFKNQRKLRGQHRILSITNQVANFPQKTHHYLNQYNHAPTVYVTGTFQGSNNGQDVCLEYSDLWIFNPETNLVNFRKSWISTPGV